MVLGFGSDRLTLYSNIIAKAIAKIGSVIIVMRASGMIPYDTL